MMCGAFMGAMMAQQGGGGELVEKDINFYEPVNGTLVYSYTFAEANALTAMPPVPPAAVGGLAANGWTHDLSHIQNRDMTVEVGAEYVSADGASRIYLESDVPWTQDVVFSQTSSNGVVIDWGDGTDSETISGTGSVSASHSYANGGIYTISLMVDAGKVSFTQDIATAKTSVVGFLSGTNVSSMSGCCQSFPAMRFALVGVTSNRAFTGGTPLVCYVSRRSAPLNNETLYQSGVVRAIFGPTVRFKWGDVCDCRKLEHLCIEPGNGIFPNYFARNCQKMTRFVIPNGITSVGDSSFMGCSGVDYYDFKRCTSVPSLTATNAFSSNKAAMKIVVPDALYDSWKAANNWNSSGIVSHIVKASEFTAPN